MPTIPYIDRIWTARGHIDLEAPLSAAQVFDRMEPLLEKSGTETVIDGTTLTYVKENPAAQDRLATFSSGSFEVTQEADRSLLHYRLKSPALLLVFLAPLFFLAIAQATELLVEWERPTAEEKARMEKEKAEKEKEEKEPGELNPVDQWLGAPRPETLEEKKQREMEEGKDEDAKHSPRPAYVLAAIFAALFLIGRWLEPFLVRRNLRRVFGLIPSADEGGDTADAPPSRPV